MHPVLLPTRQLSDEMFLVSETPALAKRRPVHSYADAFIEITTAEHEFCDLHHAKQLERKPIRLTVEDLRAVICIGCTVVLSACMYTRPPKPASAT